MHWIGHILGGLLEKQNGDQAMGNSVKTARNLIERRDEVQMLRMHMAGAR